MPSLVADPPKRRRRSSGGGRATMPPWWGDGDAPHVRWPGVTIAIPAVARNGRWESEDGAYWFDAEAADFAAGFFPACLQHHIGSEWNGRPFELLDYQRVLVRALFGWKRTRDNLRRFRKVFLAVPKGNGKSPFGAGVGLFLAFFDGEAGSEVYAVAADKQQAGIVFSSAKVMVERNTDWEGRFEVYRDSIKAVGSTESFQVLSSDASTKHGFRPHGIVFDEFHAQPNRDLFDTLYRGMGKRQQPVLLMITTAGDDDESICFEEWDYARKVLSGTVPDPTYLPMIFEARPDEDWTLEATWRRVNPGYGITIKADYFETECRAAQAEPRKRNSFLQLHMNRWVNQATAWIPVEWWDACRDDLPSDERLRELPCAAGLDLAQKWDLSALVVAFRERLAQPIASVEVVEDEGGHTVTKQIELNYRLILVPFFWLPENTLREHEKKDGLPYREWQRLGLVTATEGDIIDYTRIYADITTRILPRFPRLKQGVIGYDPAFATDIATDLRDRAGLTVKEVLQNYTHLSGPSYVFEALIKGRRVVHGGHRVLRNHVEVVSVKKDDAGRMRPVRPKQGHKRIDGVVASLMALKALAEVPDRRKSLGVFVA